MKEINIRVRNKCSNFNGYILYDDKVANTLVAGSTQYRACDRKKLSKTDMIAMQTFPQDYDFGSENVKYVCGMSVPPVMMANIATDICEAWFLKSR